MLDLSAAFDTVDNDILIDRLQQSFGIKGQAVSCHESFLRNWTQSVSIVRVQSIRSPLTRGVPPKSVLGPVLLFVYLFVKPRKTSDKTKQYKKEQWHNRPTQDKYSKCHLCATKNDIQKKQTIVN